MKQPKSDASGKTVVESDGMVMQIIGSAVCVLLGILLLFVPQVKVLTLCYVFCAALIVVGVISIAAFFLRESYRQMQDYHFALGVMLLILGVCGLLRADEMAQQIEFYIGLIALTLSILILQSTVQLKVLDSKLWIAEMILTVVSVCGSVLILADVRPLLDKIDGFSCWVLLLVGAFSLVSLLLAWIGLRRIERKEKKEKKLVEKEIFGNADAGTDEV